MYESNWGEKASAGMFRERCRALSFRDSHIPKRRNPKHDSQSDTCVTCACLRQRWNTNDISPEEYEAEGMSSFQDFRFKKKKQLWKFLR